MVVDHMEFSTSLDCMCTVIGIHVKNKLLLDFSIKTSIKATPGFKMYKPVSEWRRSERWLLLLVGRTVMDTKFWRKGRICCCQKY